MIPDRIIGVIWAVPNELAPADATERRELMERALRIDGCVVFEHFEDFRAHSDTAWVAIPVTIGYELETLH